MPAKKKKLVPVNLLPKNEFDSSIAGRILKWVLTTFRVMVISVELVVIIGFLSRFYLDTQNSDLNDEIKNKQSNIEAYATVEKDFRNTQKRLSIFSEFSSATNYSAPVLTKITHRLPPEAQLVSFSKKGQEIELKAASLSEQSIAQLITNLQEDPDFSEIILTSAESSNDSPLITFTLKINPEHQIEEGT